jgi:hypothetical protein
MLRKSAKNRVAIALIMALSASITTSSIVLSQASSQIMEQFQPQFDYTAPPLYGYTGAYIDDVSHLTGSGTGLIGEYWLDQSKRIGKESFLCKSFSDPNCSNAESVSYFANLEACKSTSETNCVSNLEAIKPDGTVVEGKFAQDYPLHPLNTFVGDPALGIPDGTTNSLWTFDGINHQGGDQFLVKVNLSTNNAPRNTSTAPADFSAGIFPVSIAKNRDYHAANYTVGKTSTVGNIWFGTYENKNPCGISGDEGDCAVIWPQPNVRFKLTIRTARPLAGFFHGRIENPNISITQAGFSTVTSIEAGSVKVPILYTTAKNSMLPVDLNAYLDGPDPEAGLSGGFVYVDRTKPLSRESVYLIRDGGAYDATNFKEYLLWLPVAGDRAFGTKSIWFVRSLNQGQIFQTNLSKCLQNKSSLQGIVATNADMYIAAPPTFNALTSTLDYKVASPHLDENGSPNVGTYSLAIRSDVARCIYHFTSAPISASVSIISSDGQTQTASTTMVEKDGWIYLNAAGYGYSSPTVKVRLTQDVPAKKSTITCIKGKMTKTVTAVKPTCPMGYKKK